MLTYENFEYGSADGFAIAAAFVGLSKERELDPEIGQIKFVIKKW